MQLLCKLRQSGIGGQQQIHCIVLSVVQYSEVCILILTFTLESKHILICGARAPFNTSLLFYFQHFLEIRSLSPLPSICLSTKKQNSLFHLDIPNSVVANECR